MIEERGVSQDPDSNGRPSGDAFQSDTGFVALLDVLGFKRMSSSRQQAVVDTLQRLVDREWQKTS